MASEAYGSAQPQAMVEAMKAEKLLRADLTMALHNSDVELGQMLSVDAIIFEIEA